jgi:hypothetical protein
MCFTFTKHYTGCSCDVVARVKSNSYSGNYTRDNIRYNNALDNIINNYCLSYKP